MSGPIIRKYGFPNFDEIFGKRELQHGVDDKEAPKEADTKSDKPDAKDAEPKAKSKSS